MAGNIPFSTFVDVTTSTVSPAATFGRLNALVATDSNTGDLFEEFSTASDVTTRYGVGSPQATYASTFFNYTSKGGTKPQKLTFYNWRQVAKPYTLTGGQVTELDTIKVKGTLRVSVGGEEKDLDVDMSNATNFSDCANIINSALQTGFAGIGFACNWDTDNQRFIITASNGGDIEFIKNDVEVFNLYQGDITNTLTIITPAVTIREAGNFKMTAEQITSTSTASGTLKIQINEDPREIYSYEYQDIKTTPLTSFSDSISRTSTGKLQIKNIKCEPAEVTITGAVVTYEQNTAVDIAVLCCLLAETGATTTPYESAKPLNEAIQEICLNNGDYVTLSFDSTIIINLDIHGQLHQVMEVINSYPLGRYYLVACFSDQSIQQMKQQNNWEHVMSTENLIVTRVVDGTHTNINAFVQSIIASIDYGTANGAINVNFIDASGYEADAIRTASDLTQCNDDRLNTIYITGGYGQDLTLYGEGHIMGSTFSTMGVALGETWIKAQLQVQGMSILTGSNLISLRGKQGQGQVIALFSSIMRSAVTAGIIVQGATLTATEQSTIINVTGISDIVAQVETEGWYVQVDTITDEHIANKTIPVTMVYVANLPVNRIQARSFVIGA